MTISFKEFITEESQADKLAILEHEIDNYIKIGEIIKPEFTRLKWQIDNAIEKEAYQLSIEHTHGKGNAHYDIEPALGDLGYGVPHAASGVLALKNKIAKIKSAEARSTPLFKDVVAYYEKRKGIAEKLNKLKELIVTTAQKRAEKKEVAHKALQKSFSDSSSLIKVLEQHRSEYIQRAGEMAAEQFAEYIKQFKAVGFDLDKMAPAPTRDTNWDNHQAMNRKRNFFKSITDGEGNIRKPSAVKKKKFIADAEKNAHDSYMAWVAKMVSKIGKSVKSAKMTGNPWTGSTLSVVSHDGEKQTWHTKMILNRSKYDTLFNQFPSRRID